RRHFARHEIIQLVLVAAAGGIEEPIIAGLAVKLVEGGLIVHGGVVEEIAAVPAAAGAAVQMVDAGREVGVGAAPFGHERVQGVEVRVVVGGIADDNVIATVAVERVAAAAADQQIASGAALQRIRAGAADQNIVGRAATGIECVVARIAEERGRDRHVIGRRSNLFGDQLGLVVYGLTVDGALC